MEKLYALTNTTEIEKVPLYIKMQDEALSDLPDIHKSDKLDFMTYFNSFHTIKWKEYTTIKTITLKLSLDGDFRVSFYEIKDSKKTLLKEEHVSGTDYCQTFDVSELSGAIMGFELEAEGDDCKYFGGAWYGDFDEWEDKKIGVSITTFKREPYVKRTMVTLKNFSESNPWLYALVVDNGSTLNEEKEEHLRVIHNRNYGGSGGFTRGIMEYLDEDQVDYVLLMDDDINLEPSAIERTHSLLSGLKDKYKESFLAGAMLSMEEPCMQHENTACWNQIISKGFFVGLNLADEKNLSINGLRPRNTNDYAGWWYCCIPITRIKEIGLPLPFFIKCDDMEYGIRNNRPVICLNGIGVWHEIFVKKLNYTMRFFSNRNTFILNHFARECGRKTLVLSVVARSAKWVLHGDWKNLAMLYVALTEYGKGFEKLTSIRADDYFNKQNELVKHVSYLNIFKIPAALIRAILQYGSVHKKYINFRDTEMHSDKFWKNFLFR